MMRRTLIILALISFGGISYARPYPGFETVLANPALYGLNGINPQRLEVGVFYYGILYKDKIYYSVVHKEERPIGQRSGGHFKLLREIMRSEYLQAGHSKQETEEYIAKLQRVHAQAQVKDATFLHEGLAFGFKVVKEPDGSKYIKWHAWNSFKSTVHKTSTKKFTSGKMYNIVQYFSVRAGIPAMVAHPLYDPDLILHPKYIDPDQREYFRGEERLWDKTDRLVGLVRRANSDIGFEVDATSHLTRYEPNHVCDRLIAHWLSVAEPAL